MNAGAQRKVLAGDIGGTKCLLGLFEAEGMGPARTLRPLAERRFESASYPGLTPLVREFLGGTGVEAAAFGVPGPVTAGRSRLTNLPWTVDADEIARETRIPRVGLVNDFFASARGALHLPLESLAVVHGGRPDPAGAVGILGAGTGLGMAYAAPRGDGEWSVFPSEGGHASFAPRSETEDAVLRELRKRFGRVSVERVLSGPGLGNLYDALRDARCAPETEGVRGEIAASPDPAPVIHRHGLDGSDPLAALALRTFVSIYGAVTGDWALLLLARGGIRIVGGIAPRILPLLQSPLFEEAYLDKGRHSGLVASIPVHTSLETRTGLLGAAREALLLLDS